MADDEALTFHVVTADRWVDLEALFGPGGACSGCWCMYFRLPRSEFNELHSAGRREAIKSLVESGAEPGLLAYDGDRAVGWVCVGPREQFPILERSRYYRRVDDKPVWSVVCFFVAKSCRRRGVTSGLLRASVEHAASRGASIVEGYPFVPRKPKVDDLSAYRGLPSVFERVGFVEVARRHDDHPIVRYYTGAP